MKVLSFQKNKKNLLSPEPIKKQETLEEYNQQLESQANGNHERITAKVS